MHKPLTVLDMEQINSVYEQEINQYFTVFQPFIPGRKTFKAKGHVTQVKYYMSS